MCPPTLDIAVGAPYEVNEDTNSTGAVYIYYGRKNWTAFEQQMPSKVHVHTCTVYIITCMYMYMYMYVHLHDFAFLLR